MGKRNEWEEESTERERREGNVGGEREGGEQKGLKGVRRYMGRRRK